MNALDRRVERNWLDHLANLCSLRAWKNWRGHLVWVGRKCSKYGGTQYGVLPLLVGSTARTWLTHGSDQVGHVKLARDTFRRDWAMAWTYNTNTWDVWISSYQGNHGPWWHEHGCLDKFIPRQTWTSVAWTDKLSQGMDKWEQANQASKATQNWMDELIKLNKSSKSIKWSRQHGAKDKYNFGLDRLDNLPNSTYKEKPWQRLS